MAAAIKKDEVMIDEYEADMQERRKTLLRRKIPSCLTLQQTLMAMTKTELENIGFNLYVSGLSTLKKADLVDRLQPEIIGFARKWFVSILEDQYQSLKALTNSGGLTLQYDIDDTRLDYLRGIGILSCGNKDGKLAWYMPLEMQAEFQKLDSQVYAEAATLNTKMLRLASGLLRYCGIMERQELFGQVSKYLETEQEIGLGDFLGVIFNGACWMENIFVADEIIYYHTVYNPQELLAAQSKCDMDYASFPYEKVYAAGDIYVADNNDAYLSLMSFMQKQGLDLLSSGYMMSQIESALQNEGDENRDRILDYIQSVPELADTADKGLREAVNGYYQTLPLWRLKGHNLDSQSTMSQEMVAEELPDPKFIGQKVAPFIKTVNKVGRNDPCPCGSGKKYKNCCYDKDWR